MARVVHFEIHADNPERAVKFYSELLGWQFTRWGGPMEYHLINTGPDSQPGINGGLLRRHGPPPTEGQPVNSYVCTCDVAAIDESVAKAISLGGQVALAKMPVPGVGWLAYVKDTEGNIVGMMQMDKTVK
jgi:predicted enzyme related to lactoylglutathione lyase